MTKAAEIYNSFAKQHIYDLLVQKYASPDVDERRNLAQSLSLTLSRVDDDTLAFMLRQRIEFNQLARWLIGLGRRVNLLDTMGYDFLEHPLYAHVCCFALARMVSQDAVIYLEMYLEKFLVPEIIVNMEDWNVSIDSALVALEYMESASNPTRLAYFFEQRHKFIADGERILTASGRAEDSKAWVERWNVLRPEGSRTRFKQLMGFADQFFG